LLMADHPNRTGLSRGVELLFGGAGFLKRNN